MEIRNGSDFLSIESPMGIVIPPFSIIEWHVGIGDLEWKGFFSKTAFSARNFNKPCTFSNFYIPNSNTDLKNLTDKLIIDHEINISKDNSWLSEKTKEVIDLQFRDDFKIEEIAEKLAVNRSFIARSFKKSYGLSPVDYRHKLRVFEGLRLMNQERLEITQSAVDSGFSSIQRFEEHFKEQIGVTPSKFSISRFQKK